MSRITDVVEGWTGRLTFTLYSQAPGAAVATAFVGTGLTLSDLVLKNQTGDLVPTAGDFGWVSAAAGTVYYDPDAADLLATGGAHTIRFQVTDGAGKVVFFPSGKADEIKVFKP